MTDLVFIDDQGEVQGKRADIASHASGAMVQTAAEFVEEPVMKLYGDTAIVTVKVHVKVQLQGRPLEALCRICVSGCFRMSVPASLSGTVRILSANEVTVTPSTQ